MSAYIVERKNLGSNKRPFYRHVIVNAAGEHVGDSFSDIGGERLAQNLADLLNAAYEAGAASSQEAYRALREQHDVTSSKCIGLQFELGRAEAQLRNAGDFVPAKRWLATTKEHAAELASRLTLRGLNFRATNCSGTEFGCWVDVGDEIHALDDEEVAQLVCGLSLEG